MFGMWGYNSWKQSKINQKNKQINGNMEMTREQEAEIAITCNKTHTNINTFTAKNNSIITQVPTKEEVWSPSLRKIKAVIKLQMALLFHNTKTWRDNTHKHSPCSTKSCSLILFLSCIAPLYPKTSSLPGSYFPSLENRTTFKVLVFLLRQDNNILISGLG